MLDGPDGTARERSGYQSGRKTGSRSAVGFDIESTNLVCPKYLAELSRNTYSINRPECIISAHAILPLPIQHQLELSLSSLDCMGSSLPPLPSPPCTISRDEVISGYLHCNLALHACVIRLVYEALDLCSQRYRLSHHLGKG